MKNRDRITSETVFLCDVLNKDDAVADYDLNVIAIGSNTLTLETLIHELNEIQINQTLENLGYINTRVTYKRHFQIPKYISHLLSPYGYKSLIYPCNKTNKKEQKLDE
jgi:hypothetical protein